MKRKRLTGKQHLELFVHHGGVCHWCGHKIDTRKPWHIDHVIPLAMGGDDTMENMAPIHDRPCHAEKTHKGDVPNIAKAKRRALKHAGIRKPSKFAGSRDSKWKRKVNGQVVMR